MQEDKGLLLSRGMSQHQEQCDLAMVQISNTAEALRTASQIGCIQARLAEVAAAQETS